MSALGSFSYNYLWPGMAKADIVARDGNQVFISWNRDHPMDKRYPVAINPWSIGMSEVHPKTLELYGRIKGKYVTEAMTKALNDNPLMIQRPTEAFMDSISDTISGPSATRTKAEMVKRGIIRSEVAKYAKGKKEFYDELSSLNEPKSFNALREYID